VLTAAAIPPGAALSVEFADRRVAVTAGGEPPPRPRKKGEGDNRQQNLL
jgi:hypothetical protein